MRKPKYEIGQEVYYVCPHGCEIFYTFKIESIRISWNHAFEDDTKITYDLKNLPEECRPEGVLESCLYSSPKEYVKELIERFGISKYDLLHEVENES